eukprot:Cvel_20463.t1-p1 / transcript=Cvel_20463.t1 / gene=Cvel_20463 / organism=Chromera_velia_CCMP2878 / gene_product=DNA polymerase alpha catalytic subunit, putative / transcript_product=DNA polymerase alpha catalytic subunit, putative / location=Cvel_scaffold1837:21183-37852(+) / protein_length=1666 / sequence_SO=supercontig / SO=protein_coding / is_pseudo=false
MKSRKQAQNEALARLRAKREGKQVETKEDEGNEDLFETIDEAEYEERVKERRKNQFVEDEDGLGYADDGREIFEDGSEGERDDEGIKNNKGLLAKGGNKVKKQVDLGDTTGMKPVGELFAKMAAKAQAAPGGISKKETKALYKENDRHADADLEAKLRMLDEDESEEEDQARAEEEKKKQQRLIMQTAQARAANKKHKNGPAYVPAKGGVSHNPWDALDEVAGGAGRFEGAGLDGEGRPKRGSNEGGTMPVKRLRFEGDRSADTDETMAPSDDLPGGGEDDDIIMEHRQERARTRETKLRIPTGGLQFIDEDVEETEGHQGGEGAAAASAGADGKETAGPSGAFSNAIKSNVSESVPVCADGSLPFYLVDLWEDSTTGRVFLFGKVWGAPACSPFDPAKGSREPPKSCCVVVKNMERCLYLKLPEDDEGEEGNMNEKARLAKAAFDGVRKQRGCKMYKMKAVGRNYAFDAPGMTRGTDQGFVKLHYPAAHSEANKEVLPGDPSNDRYPPPDFSLSSSGEGWNRVVQEYDEEDGGGQHVVEAFSHVFGARQSLIELFLVKRRIMGPSWLKISGFKEVPESRKVSWCAHEVTVEGAKSVRRWNAQKAHQDFNQEELEQWEEAMQQAQEAEEEDGATPAASGWTRPRWNDGIEPPHAPLTVASIALETATGLGGVQSTNAGKGGNQSHEIVVASVVFKKDCPLEQTDVPLLMSINKRESFVAMRKPQQGSMLPTGAEAELKKMGVSLVGNERSLIALLMGKIQEVDPDVVVGQNLCGFSMDILSTRCQALNIAFWHRMSRLKRAKGSKLRLPNEGGGGAFRQSRQMTAGRLQCDTLLMGRELCRGVTSHDLPSLVEARMADWIKQLIETHQDDKMWLWFKEFKSDQLLKYFVEKDGVRFVCAHAFLEALAAFKLTFRLECLPLTRQLTNIAGNVWARSLMNQRAERNEFLLMHEFHKEKFVCPDKEFKQFGQPAQAKGKKGKGKGGGQDDDQAADGDGEQQGQQQSGGGKTKQKAQYAGGLVLEPKAGLYDTYILLLDFNSLYPSIIQEYNICFTSVKRPDGGAEGFEDFEGKSDESVTDSVLPGILARLVKARRDVKDLMKKEKTDAKRALFNTRQLALKLTANSMYGCLGFSSSRFHCKPMAALITRHGRRILEDTKAKAETELQLEVVYGDTDSIMVNSGLPSSAPDPESLRENFGKALGIGRNLKESVNKLYRKLELDIDGVFSRLLLLKKKKYAAKIVEDFEKGKEKTETKGLDLVRRDWCVLSREMGEAIVNKILSNVDKETSLEWVHTYIEEVARCLDERKIPLEKYIITKGLTKLPNQYPDAKSLPHVQVALRMQQKGVKFSGGEEIPYILCCPPVGGGAEAVAADTENTAERAFHPDEVRDRRLTVDTEMYKANQLLGPIGRLLAPLEGTSPARIAECLGLDKEKYAHKAMQIAQEEAAAGNDGENAESTFDISDAFRSKEESYDKYTHFGTMPCPFHECKEFIDAKKTFKTLRCSVCKRRLSNSFLENTLWIILRNLAVNAESVRKCTECGTRTRRITLQGGNVCPNLSCTSRESGSAGVGDKGSLQPSLTTHDLYKHQECLHFMLSLPAPVTGDDIGEDGVIELPHERPGASLPPVAAEGPSRVLSEAERRRDQALKAHLRGVVEEFMVFSAYDRLPS